MMPLKKRYKLASISIQMNIIRSGYRSVYQWQKGLYIRIEQLPSLTNHPKVKEAATIAIEKYGTSFAVSRFLNGIPDFHINHEKKLPKIENKDEVNGLEPVACCMFPLVLNISYNPLS